ncbi:MAG TPA: FtsH protease activity modulator HflK, partial [Desulfosalsimonadaceae bacterium]|nr:FtsH protease activity modulator HflK [Desulfosalsimonadaceae bacterium]
MTWDWEKLQQRQKERSSGDGSGGGGPRPPQMDEVLNKLKNYKFSGGWIIVILALLLLFFGSSMIYTVDVNEVGVVQRFGEYSRTTQSGLHFKLPAGIEKVTKVKTKRIYKEGFGVEESKVTDTRTTYSVGQETIDVSLMLTGDLNVGVVPWIVQYRIKDAYNYLFKVRDVKGIIRDMSEATMRLVVGDRSINEVISSREEIANAAEIRLQDALDQAETGVDVVTVELGDTNVPGPVQDSFNEVNQAYQEKEQMIYEARQEYNRVIPKARGEAEATIEAAKGYAKKRINRAEGDAARFMAQYKEYAKAKDVTRRRLYLETIKSVLPNLGEIYIIDSEQKN